MDLSVPSHEFPPRQRMTSAAIEQPYDVYATAADFGLSSNGTAEAKSYFASDLCVSEDVAIGTDSSDSQVAEGAGTFNLETNTVVYAKRIYDAALSASTTKISDGVHCLKNIVMIWTL